MYDSLARAPVAGATVQVVPVDATLLAVARRTVTSDAAGNFTTDALPPGRYLVGFFHARLDSLGLDAPVRRVELRPGAPLMLELTVPSATSIIRLWCGAGSVRDSTGVILGHVRDASTRGTVSDGELHAQWSAITLSAGGARASVQSSSARTSPLGWFGVCGVPRGGVLALRAMAGADSSPVLEIDVPDDGVLLHDFSLPRGAARTPQSATLVRGVVRDPTGAPLAGARIRLSGAEDEVRADARGAFQIPARALGSQLIDVRMIGFVPMRRVVDVEPGTGTDVDLTMSDFPMEIDTVRVLARRPARREAEAGFESRRRLGHGEFLDAETIERRRPLVFSDLLRGMPGTEIRSVDMMTRVVQMRASDGRGSCVPVIIVDGVRLNHVEMNIDDAIPAEMVRAIEVYPRRIQAPPEFQTPDCGSVVVWTGARGWLARPRRSNR